MELKMSKGKMILFVIALLLSNLALMGDMVIIPSIASFYEKFGENINLVNYIVSGPSLISVFSALICGKLIQYMSKKTLLVIGFSIFAVATIFGIAIESAFYIAIMRTFVGVAVGIVMTAALALLAEIFVDEKKRSMMLGVYVCSQAVIGTLISLVAGFFAANSWQSVFKVYWIAVPVLLIMILFLPKTPAESRQIQEGEIATKKEKVNWSSFGALNLGLMAFVALYMVVFFQIAVYVMENAIGNEAAVGLLASLGTAGAAVSSISFGLIYTKLKRGSIIPAYAILAVCYVLLFFFPNITVAIIACTFMGAAYGIGYNYYVMRTTVIVPPSRVSSSIGVVNAANGIGMFFSTYLITGIAVDTEC